MTKKSKVLSIIIGLMIIICLTLGILGFFYTKEKYNTNLNGNKDKETDINVNDSKDDETEKEEYLLGIYKKENGEYCKEQSNECNTLVVNVKVSNKNAKVIIFDNNNEERHSRLENGKLVYYETVKPPEYALIDDDNLKLISFKENNKKIIKLSNDKDNYEFMQAPTNSNSKNTIGIKYHIGNKVGFYDINQDKILLEDKYTDIKFAWDYNYLLSYTDKEITSLNLKTNKISKYENNGSIPVENWPENYDEDIITLTLEKANKYNTVAYYRKDGTMIVDTDSFHTDVTFIKAKIIDNKIYAIVDKKLNIYTVDSLERSIDLSKEDEVLSIIFDYHVKKASYILTLKDSKIKMIEIETLDKTEIGVLEEDYYIRPYITYTKVGEPIGDCEENINKEGCNEHGCPTYISKKATKAGYYIGLGTTQDKPSYEIYFNPKSKEVEKKEATFCAGVK